MSAVHEAAQDFEREWWGSCVNTFGEEVKQLTYAHRMQFGIVPDGGRWPAYDLGGRSVIDLGGGPVSILLKCFNRPNSVVVDPCPYPKWVLKRYREAGIELARKNAEDYRNGFVRDEAWIYNVLQHVVDPKAVIDTAKAQARVLRIFEWIETGTNIGHPHNLHADELNEWIGGTGKIENVDENGAVGLAYYGVFDL